MEFIKTEKGWLNLKTQELVLFGDLSVKLSNKIQIDLDLVKTKIMKYFSLSRQTIPQYIVGRNDNLNDTEQEIFMDSNIMAIAIFWENAICSYPTNAIHYKDNRVNYSKYYLPIYKKDLQKLFDKQSEMDLLTYSTQEKMLNLIRTLANKEIYGTLLTEEDDTALLHSIVNSWLPTLNDNPIPTIIREFEGKYLVSYVVNSIGELYGRDILELINFNYSLSTCPICNQMFVKRDGRINFCLKCSADKKAQKKYNDRKRKRNTIQIEHKAIVDMLRNRNENYNDFVTESYYYRDLIDGKEVSSCPAGYDSSIQTKGQYEYWLKQKHQELTKRPKKRPVH